MEVECDAFNDLYSVWDLICKRYLEAVTVRQHCVSAAENSGTVLPAVELPQDSADDLNRKHLRREHVLLFYTLSKHFPHRPFECHRSAVNTQMMI